MIMPVPLIGLVLILLTTRQPYPVITEIQFADPGRTRASARVTIGYSGATVALEKENGRWVAKRLAGVWIT